MPTTPPNPPAAVATLFDSYPEEVRLALLDLRRLILDTAEETEGAGPIEETIKWGQPAYLTAETGSGSTIRIAPTKPGGESDYAMYFICSTNLVDTFQSMFGAAFTYEGNRALLFSTGKAPPEDALRACVEMALTYHQSKR